MPVTPGIRRSLADIQAEYERGDTQALETLMRAWKGIKDLPADDPHSFFTLGGFHGEPFRGEGATDPHWWGGYCEHGTVLFPTWHRAYLHTVERALKSIPGCADVTLPFWDETSPDSLANGVPDALTWETFELDGHVIPNPLRSFVLPVAIADAVKGDPPPYNKPVGYETVRYPLSGLVGTQAERVATAEHNAKYPDYDVNVAALNDNVRTWLAGTPVINGKQLKGAGLVQQKFVRCLDAPSYTLFSNTTSAGAYNQRSPGSVVVPLENPHNSIHLAVGGFDVPNQDQLSPIAGANGDMGENDTAGLDPIFYFHHCFIDYVFWIWQRRTGSTQALVIDSQDPGASYQTADRPPPAGRQPNDRLDADSALNPFTTVDGSAMTSAAVADIAKLGYSYGPGSLDRYAEKHRTAMLDDDPARSANRSIHIEGLDRSKLRGSFIISAFAEVDGKIQAIGHDAVLSRWHVQGCANCMAHLNASADFPLPATARAASEGTTDSVHVRVTRREDLLSSRTGGAFAGVTPPEPLFTVEIR